MKILQITEVLLVHSNIVDNDSKWAFSTFASNKSFSQVLDISAKNFISLKIFNSDLSYIEVMVSDGR